MATLEIQIADDLDDIVHRQNIHTMFAGSLLVGNSSLGMGFALRFPNVTIPAGSTIQVAHVILQSDLAGQSSGANVCTITCLEANDPLNPTTDGDWHAGARLSPEIPWTIPTIGLDEIVNTPSLVDLVQAKINQGSWNSSDALVVLIHNDALGGSTGQPRRFWSYDNDSAKTAILHVEYLAPPVSSLGATISGSATVDIEEQDVKDGGKALIITLTGAVWNATLGDDNVLTQDLIDGLDSDGSETDAWDAVVKTALTFANVFRTSDTICTISLPSFPDYDLFVDDETITVTVPDSAFVIDTLFALKPLEECVVSSTTLQNDDELLIPVGANELWNFTCAILFDAHSNPDIDFSFSGPASSVISFAVMGAAGNNLEEGDEWFVNGIGLDVQMMVVLSGTIKTAGTPGNLQLKWAQNVTFATPVCVHAGSMLIGHNATP